MDDALRQYWHPVARAGEIDTQPVAAQLLDERIVLYRLGEDIVALRDLCVHRGTPLSLGWVDDDGTVVCRYHGWEYDSTGACTRIPSLPPEGRIPPKARVPSYRTEIRYGLVWVSLVDEPNHPIPDYPAYDDESMVTTLYHDYRWTANSARVIENVLDYTHFPWVHEGLLGDRNHPVYPEIHDDGLY